MKKIVIFLFFLTLVFNQFVFSQTVVIDKALSNATKDISESVPRGSVIAVLNISSENMNLSDFIINELITDLVNTRLFQVVPRSIVEFEAAKSEFGFQMYDDVSDESKQRLGQFLGADTIITGTVIKDSETTYRLTVNSIHLENFYIMSSYRTSVQNDRHIRTLVGDSGGIFYEDYTTGQRVGMGFANTLFGIGSIINGHHLGWVTTGLESLGVLFIIYSKFAYNTQVEDNNFWGEGSPFYNDDFSSINMWSYAGYVAIGAGVLYGFVIPFFHHKQNPTNISTGKTEFPFNLELVSGNNKDINGLMISYKMKI